MFKIECLPFMYVSELLIVRHHDPNSPLPSASLNAWYAIVQVNG